MGPLNEWQRRMLDVTQQHRYLLQANAGGPPPEYFAYTTPQMGSAAAPLTNGVAVQSVIAIQADAWFLWEYLSIAVTIPATANLGGPEQFTDAANLLVQISFPGTADELFAIPGGFGGVPGALVAGSPIAAAAGIPIIFPTPILLPPKTNLNIVVQKYGAVAADNPDMTGAWVMLNGSRVQVWN